MTAPQPRPGILGIASYVPGRASLAGQDKVMRLSSNEGALGPSPRAIAAYGEAAREIGRYPDGGSVGLRAAIAARYGLDAERIVCGCGSDDLIHLMAKAYAGGGDEVLYSEHGFLVHIIAARGAGAEPVSAPETDLTASVDALLERLTPKTRMLFLANPNNPTGTYLARAALERLHAGLPEDVMLVIDAAYAEYVTAADYEPGASLVEAFDNVVMIRTFSKIHALAGLRLGWVYCPAAVADVLNRVRAPFSVSLPAQAAAVAALEDTDFIARSVAHNERWRDWLTAELRALGLEVPPSVANFVMVRFPGTSGRDATTANAHLNARGIIPREIGAYGLPDCLRISVGTEEEMRAVRDALAEFMA